MHVCRVTFVRRQQVFVLHPQQLLLANETVNIDGLRTWEPAPFGMCVVIQDPSSSAVQNDVADGKHVNTQLSEPVKIVCAFRGPIPWMYAERFPLGTWRKFNHEWHGFQDVRQDAQAWSRMFGAHVALLDASKHHEDAKHLYDDWCDALPLGRIPLNSTIGSNQSVVALSALAEGCDTFPQVDMFQWGENNFIVWHNPVVPTGLHPCSSRATGGGLRHRQFRGL